MSIDAPPRRRVVVIDDATDHVALVKLALGRDSGFEVVAQGRTGCEAVRLAAQHQPDLVLLDVSMPDMDGLQALPQVLAAAPATQVIMFSGFEAKGMEDAAMRLGAAGYVEKDLAVTQLAGRLTAVLDRRIPGGARAAVASTPAAVSSDEPLFEHPEFFRQAFDQAAIGMAWLSLGHTVVRTNDALCRMVGRPAAELIGVPVIDLVHPEDRTVVAGHLADLGERTSAPSRTDHRVVSADGSVLQASTTAVTVLDDAGRPLYLLVQVEDVTPRANALKLLGDAHAELEQRTAQLQRMNERLERSNADLADFASVAAHDLRTPLGIVRSFAELLDDSGPLEPKQSRYIDHIVSSVSKMETLIHDLLAYSRLGTDALRPTLVDLGLVVREVLDWMAPTLVERGAEVHLGDLPTLVADETQVRQLFQNVLTNAVKFVPAERTPSVTVAVTKEHSMWRFAVTDNGIGIPSAQRDRVFRMFQRLHAPGTYDGTGIGLAMCKRVVEGHGGRIWVADPTGEACTEIVFTLPTGT